MRSCIIVDPSSLVLILVLRSITPEMYPCVVGVTSNSFDIPAGSLQQSCCLQEDLLAAVEAEQWFTGGANQAMRFGDFPQWAEDLAESIRGSVDTPQACCAACLPVWRHVDMPW